MPDGISFRPEIFQKYTDEASSDIPGVVIQMDDILVEGSDYAEHDAEQDYTEHDYAEHDQCWINLQNSGWLWIWMNVLSQKPSWST